MNRILLIDLSERELNARNTLQARLDEVNALTKNGSETTAAQREDLALMKEALASSDPVDGFLQAVATQLAARDTNGSVDSWSEVVATRRDYVPVFGLPETQQRLPHPASLAAIEEELAAVCGLLQTDNCTNPAQDGFVARVSAAAGEYAKNRDLFRKAFARFGDRFQVSLRSQIAKDLVDPGIIGCLPLGGTGTVPAPAPGGTPTPAPSAKLQATGALPAAAARVFDANAFGKPLGKGPLFLSQLVVKPMPQGTAPHVDDPVSVLSGRNLAAVVRRLVADKVGPNDPWIDSHLDNAYNQQTGVVDGASPSAIEIMLPDLEEDVDIEIQKENLHAVQAIYFAYMLEEMRLFQVVERIVEIFRQGLLPLGRGKVGDYLFNYYKKAAERITEAERRDLYMRLFGAPGGNPAGEANRDFNELWLRFVSSVSSFARQNTVERMLRSTVPVAVSQEQVRKSGRDLGANLSRNGYGIAYFAATELQGSILEFRDVLQDAELRGAFGARDMWQVIDQVNVNYLGGARNTHRYRTQSRAGAVIIRWIANNVGRLSSIGGPVLYVDSLSSAALRATSGSHNPTQNPTDWDLVNACEQWLAVGGVQDQNIEQYSQPIESPVMTSRPIDMPQAARDVLGGMGISLPGM